ncbi:MAG: hypothetical protein WD738_24535 [Pirellulales bacterium]
MRRLDAMRVRVSSLAAAGSLRAAITLLLIGLHSATSFAAIRSWDGGGGTDTDWTTDANWSSNIEPVAGDTAEFDRGAAFNYTVTFPLLPFSADETTDRLIVGSNSVTFANDRSSTNYLVGSPATDEAGRGVIIGEEANDTAAALTSHLGLLSTAAATLGHVAGASGTLTLDQNNDQFNVTGSSADTELIIGRYGTGVLNISGGADVNVTNASGNALLGQYVGSNGTASIDGAGSTWSIATSLVVGGSGNGTLDVTNGGNVNSATGLLGASGGVAGNVTVTGVGSTWSNSGSMYVGGSTLVDGGNGTLSIINQGLVDIGGTLKLWPGGNVSLAGGTLETAAIELAGGSFNRTAGSLRLGSGLSIEPSGLLGGSVAVGAGEALETDGDLYVGNAGAGTLNITTGGDVSNDNGHIGNQTGSVGVVTVDGTDSSWTINRLLSVGNFGSGTLNVTGGAEAQNVNIIGEHNGSVGQVYVDGIGSLLTTSLVGLTVARDGTGALHITNGASVSTVSLAPIAAAIGAAPGSNGTVAVDGAGSRWSVAGGFIGMAGLDMRVGSFGNGALDITNGGVVDVKTGTVSVGVEGGSIGTINVDGPGSSLTSSFGTEVTLRVGQGGEGTVNITNGGNVKSNYGFIGGLGIGVVNVDGAGSKWTDDSELGIGFVIIEVGSSGTLSVTNGGMVRAGGVTSFGEIRGDGNIVVVSEVRNRGLVSPGTSPGSLDIDGDYTQTTEGELLIELDSTAYDQLLVTGEAALAGTLTVKLLGGFTPDIGQTFTILTADDVDGEFTTEVLPSVPGLIFDVLYNPQSVVLQILAAGIAGDYNADGIVDAADYVVWRKYNNTATTLPNDSTPGTSAADYDVWRAHFGDTIGTGAGDIASARNAVPEPCTLVLALAGLAFWTRLRVNHRRKT